MKKILKNGKEINIPKFDLDILSFSLCLMEKYDISFSELSEIIKECMDNN